MRILVINVNTSESMTRDIGEQAQAAAAAGTEIVAATPRFGPASVESILESHLSAVGVIDCALREADGHDAVILAGFGELGREGLQELLSIPVIDITEAAAHVACLLGRTYAVVTTVARAVPAIEDRLALAGLGARCTTVRAANVRVLELAAQTEATIEAVTRAAAAAVRDDGAEVICLGCAGMAGIAERVSAEVGVPVVDGVAAAVQLAQALHALGLRTSKVGFYAPSPEKAIAGWPLEPSRRDQPWRQAGAG
jgi:allantoin racemase